MGDPLWFNPLGPFGTQLFVTSTGSDRTRVLEDPGNTPPKFLRVYNAGNAPAFVELGGSTVTARIPTTALAGSFPVASGQVLVLHLNGMKWLAAISSTTAMALYLSPQGS
jgi:hypothetical protein